MSEKHEFVPCRDAPDYRSCGALAIDPRSCHAVIRQRRCGLPPDAEVHRTGPSEDVGWGDLIDPGDAPPQAQPEEAERTADQLISEMATVILNKNVADYIPFGLEDRVRDWLRGKPVQSAPPPAQPEGEPKRIGGMSEEEWLVALSTGRFDLRQAGDLITAAFGERA